MNSSLIALTLLSFVIALVFTGWLKQVFQAALLDIPNDRSSHTQPTPRGGGLGFLVAFIVTALAAWVSHRVLPEAFGQLAPAPLQIIAVLVPLAVVGLVDDRRNVPAKVRYAVQLGAAAIALVCFGLPLPPEWMFMPLVLIGFGAIALIGFTALVNFYNFMDGLDGLVASVTALQLAFLAVYLQQPVWGLLAAALLGFLWWNWSPAKIFMGDVGSTVLGASVAIALIAPTADPVRHVSALAITLPLTADAIYTLTRRLLKGENIFQAHRSHLYQRLQQSGWSHRQVAIAYLLWTALLAAFILMWQGWGSWLGLGVSGVFMVAGEYYLARRRVSAEQSGV